MTQKTTRQFGRYEVLRSLGRGALGEVYLAKDPSLDRLVAIKTISGLDALPPDERKEARERFFREARAAASLNHPNIVTIHDVDEIDGTPYIVMEYLRGVTLDRHIRRGHLLPAQKVVEVGVRSALALEEAHRRGIVHRDIKPANLFLLEDGTVKVADFGLAKDPTTALTADETLMGTPNYMSPEQVSGRALDGRSDLCSLAVTLYELLAGARPFPGGSVSSVLYRIVNEPPIPLATVRDDLPSTLSALLDRAMAKSPDDRPQCGAEFASGLKTVLEQLGGLPGDMRLPPPEDLSKSKIDAGRKRSRLAREQEQGDEPPKPARRGLRVAAVSFSFLLVAAGLWTAPLWSSYDPLGDRRKPSEDWLSSHLGAFGMWLRVTPPDLLLEVTTHPPGLAYQVVAGPASIEEGGRLRIPADFEGGVTLATSDPCHVGEMTFTRDSLPESVQLETRPATMDVKIDSTPSRARIRVDGAVLGQGPLTTTLARCEDHEVEFTRGGSTPKVLRLVAGESDSWASQLGNVSLERVPDGRIVVPKSAEYEVVVRGARTGKRQALAGEAFTLPPGKYSLILESPAVLFRKKISITVASGRSLRPQVSYPGLGTLAVIALPPGGAIRVSSEATGQVRDFGVTTLPAKPLVEGVYDVEVENPVTQKIYTERVRITAGAAVQIKVRPRDWP